MNDRDFIRPRGFEEGVLLNTNNEALLAYKKAKKRMSKVDQLEEEVDALRKQLQLVMSKLNISE